MTSRPRRAQPHHTPYSSITRRGDVNPCGLLIFRAPALVVRASPACVGSTLATSRSKYSKARMRGYRHKTCRIASNGGDPLAVGCAIHMITMDLNGSLGLAKEIHTITKHFDYFSPVRNGIHMITMFLNDFSAAPSATTPHTHTIFVDHPPRRCQSMRPFDFPCPCSRCTCLAGLRRKHAGDKPKQILKSPPGRIQTQDLQNCK